MEKLVVTKYSGETEIYSEEKLRASLSRAGATQNITNQILQKIRKKIYPNITTKILYRLAFKLLKKESKHLAARYSLKKAIISLGPSGFPFEKFVAAILTETGHETKTNIIVEGKCVSHEVDVISTVDNKETLIECKFHNLQGIKTDLKVALYISARAQDIKIGSSANNQASFFLVTNTNFTTEAIKYGECVGLKMLGWNYPKDKPLKNVLESVHLHPITCLTSLNQKQKKQLIEKDIILCKQIYNEIKQLSFLGLKTSQLDNVSKEVSMLMKV